MVPPDIFIFLQGEKNVYAYLQSLNSHLLKQRLLLWGKKPETVEHIIKAMIPGFRRSSLEEW